MTRTLTPAPAAPPAGTVAERLGLPRTAGRRPLIGSHLVDSLGTGLVLTFVVVYFVRSTALPVAEVGASITLARLLALPTAIVTGRLIDRFGARATAAAGNAVSALAYAGFLATHQAWQIVLVSWLAQVGAVMYWTSSTGLVVLAAGEGERTRWFALVQTLRNTGLGIGAALGSLVLGAGGTGGLRLLVVLNAVSYLVATVLLALWRPAAGAAAAAGAQAAAQAGAGSATAAGPTPTPSAGGYRTVLRDGRYLLLVGINLSNVFGSMITSMLLAVYLVQSLHRPAWLAGSLLMMNGVQVVLTQAPVARRLEHLRPTRVLAAAFLLNALAFALYAALAAAPGVLVVAGLYAATFLYTVAETVGTPFSEELSVSLARPDLRGRYLGVYQLSWNTGQALAPGLLTLLLDRGALWPWLFLTLLALAAVPALLLLERLGGRPPLAR
ncbi:MFS transporter [Kitasatospora nipponensis]|uniref:MFS transporter n=1 Tax=Kitasatospora nipponensis TaxID=258049 RepID=A0ABP4GGY0_9ACTN